MAFDDVLNSNPDLLPIEWSREVIKNVQEKSAVLQLSKVRQLSTRIQRIAASSALATTYWVGNSANDFTNLKQTTNSEWADVNLIVEELAALVPIPHAYEQDNAFPVWEEVQGQVVEAIGAKLDAAALFGIDKPSTWPAAIITGITGAGQVTVEGSGDDLAADIAASAQQLKARGYTTNGFAVEPGTNWRLIGMRSSDGSPIYQPDLAGPGRRGLYGFPMQEVANGAWDPDQAVVIHGDWNKSIVGIRQDITFTKHESGIINDDSGVVLFNAMQQDATIWRAVFRVAWAVANPASRLGPNPGTPTGKYPFAAVVPSGS